MVKVLVLANKLGDYDILYWWLFINPDVLLALRSVGEDSVRGSHTLFRSRLNFMFTRVNILLVCWSAVLSPFNQLYLVSKVSLETGMMETVLSYSLFHFFEAIHIQLNKTIYTCRMKLLIFLCLNCLERISSSKADSFLISIILPVVSQAMMD